MKFNIFKNTSGQTLLESLLAITVIVVGVVSLISLLVNARVSAEASLEEAVAGQIGRETIEAVRFIRDSNWLKREAGLGVNYYDGLRGGSDADDYNGIYAWNPEGSAETAVLFDFTDNSINDDSAIVYQDVMNYYRQSIIPQPGWVDTGFRRWVSLYPICFDTTTGLEYLLTSDGTNCAYDLEVGIQVIVQVQWKGRAGLVHDRLIEDRLYNWKYPEGDDFSDVVF
ncbi:MAG: hypothetical protein Q8P90_01560 [bacterium]|nr:hypothetical protein [bacterium]